MAGTDKDRGRTARCPGKWYVNSIYTRPGRQQVREAVREAIAEHRGNGDVVSEPGTEQHRHRALWDAG